jgi:tRNA threonylcarbamoyladenosine biosynthesis protein TsaB
MLIIGLKTDEPKAEIVLSNDHIIIQKVVWEAHRSLSETLLEKINTLLENNKKTFKDLSAIVIFGGPGSFTGLRIGLSTANALAHSLGIPIVKTSGKEWFAEGAKRILNSEDDKIVMPDYGAEPHITLPKH